MMIDADSVICTGAIKCKKLKDAVHTIYYGDKRIDQRPEYCSGREPHIFNSETDSSFVCPFINERVEGKHIYKKVMNF